MSDRALFRAQASQLYSNCLAKTPTMGSEITGEQMQAKITAARRDAEGLKDKIKRRKDDLLDDTRKF